MGKCHPVRSGKSIIREALFHDGEPALTRRNEKKDKLLAKHSNYF